MSELSIFVDESGDFGGFSEPNSYYIVTLVFHDQSNNIQEQIERLDRVIEKIKPSEKYVHTFPIIRREEPYNNMSIDERRQLLNHMLRFVMSCNFSWYNIVVDKKAVNDKVSLSQQISKKLSSFIRQHLLYFQSYDNVIIYYDNGQQELATILVSVFTAMLTTFDYRLSSPKKYKMLQVADFICSFQLIELKRVNNCLSNSEKQFFYKKNEIRKNYTKSIKKKKFK